MNQKPPKHMLGHRPAVPNVNNSSVFNLIHGQKITEPFQTQQDQAISMGSGQMIQTQATQVHSKMIEPSPGLGGQNVFMANIISVYNDQTKEIFQVRVNPVLTIGGLKIRVAAHYGIEVSEIAIIFNGVRYQTLKAKT